MTDLNATPSSERDHISIFGRRNSGKSSLINALTNQSLAIVSDVPGTTTDPVSKSMEILPIGPVIVTDTAGIDDVGELGKMRVEKTLRVLENTDVAILIIESGTEPGEWEQDLVNKIKDRDIPLLILVDQAGDLEDFSSGEFRLDPFGAIYHMPSRYRHPVLDSHKAGAHSLGTVLANYVKRHYRGENLLV